MIQAPDEDSGPSSEELGNDGEESWCEALVRGNDAPKITWRKADAASQESSSPCFLKHLFVDCPYFPNLHIHKT